MTLFCGCGDWWPEPGDVFWYGPGDFSIYAKHRATKCISCGRRVAIGDGDGDGDGTGFGFGYGSGDDEGEQ